MQYVTRIGLYALFATVLFSSVPTTAHVPSLYRRTRDTLVQKTKNSLHLCKKKLSAIKAKITKRKPYSEGQLLGMLFASVLLFYCSMLFGGMWLAEGTHHRDMPYTEAKLLSAFEGNDEATINDYLQNKRIDPKAFIYNQQLLYWATYYRSKKAIEKLLAMGADPRDRNKSGTSVLEALDARIESEIENLKATENTMHPSNYYKELAFLHAKLEKFHALYKKTNTMAESELKQLALCAERNKCPTLPPEIMLQIYEQLW